MGQGGPGMPSARLGGYDWRGTCAVDTVCVNGGVSQPNSRDMGCGKALTLELKFD